MVAKGYFCAPFAPPPLLKFNRPYQARCRTVFGKRRMPAMRKDYPPVSDAPSPRRATTRPPESSPHQLLGVLQTLYRYRREIGAITIGAALSSALVALLLLPVYYESTTTFYAAHTDLASPERIFGQSTDAVDYYGNSDDIDRILAIGKSGELVTYMVEEFDLYERYDIDPGSLKGSYNVAQEFFSLYNIQKNKYDAVELSVEDKDPVVAARMANAARDKVSTTAQRLIKEGQHLVVNTLRANIENKQTELNELTTQFDSIRTRYGIYNLNSQTEALSSRIASTENQVAGDSVRLVLLGRQKSIPRDTLTYIRARLESGRLQLVNARKALTKFNEGISGYRVLFGQQVEATEQLALDRERYKQYQVAMRTDFPTLHLLERADVPVVKNRPHRTLIVLAATVLAFVLAVIGALLFDAYRRVDWASVTAER